MQRILVFILSLCLLMSPCGWEAAAAPTAARQPEVVLVLIDGLSFIELRQAASEDAAWQELLRHAHLGAVTLNTGKSRKEEHAYATLGAGSRAVGAPSAHGYQAEELVDGVSAAELWRQSTGLEPRGAVLVPEVFWLDQLNRENRRYAQARVGLLGQAIEEAGWQTAVLGNADQGPKPRRWAALVSMNRMGVTAYGVVGREILRAHPERPLGVATDYPLLLRAWSQLPDAVRLTVVELGDLSRYQARKNHLLPERQAELEQQILSEMARFLLRLRAEMAREDSLLVLSPMANKESLQKGLWLSPLLDVRAGRADGLLTSDSTRWEGIVTLEDVSATVLSRLGIARPTGFAGQPLQAVERVEAAREAQFWQMLERLGWVHRERSHVLGWYGMYQIGLFLLAAAVGGLRWRRGFAWIRLLVLALLFAPASFLLFSGWAPASWLLALVLWGFTVLLAWAVDRLVAPREALLLAGLAAWVPVAVDLLQGTVWMRGSLMSYDPMFGARFYGVGNEYMGVVVGGSILMVTAMLQDGRSGAGHQRRLWWRGVGCALFFLAWVVALAHPGLGSNAGGALAASIGFAFSLALLWMRELRWRWVLLVLAGAAGAGLLVLVALNSLVPAVGMSHVGRAWEALIGGDWALIGELMYRKLEMNLRLMRISLWTKVFVTALVVSFGIGMISKWRGDPVWRRYPGWMNGFLGILAASLAALALNDSGVVAAATSALYLVGPVLYLTFTAPTPPIPHRAAPGAD